MKKATVRDLRNSFARISRWIEAGESVEVTKRGKAFARILPVVPPRGRNAPKPDIMARLRADFGTLILPDSTIDHVLHEAAASHVERIS
jgi:antitoxin (DNA-binding transcriptional repressor) of toxin-antitoxin stability system